MSKAKLLLDVADGLRGLADSVTAIAEAIQGNGVDGASAAASDEQPTLAHEAAVQTVTLEQVRVVLADASRAGKTDAVRELLQRFGADRLSAIDPARFPELLHEAEGL